MSFLIQSPNLTHLNEKDLTVRTILLFYVTQYHHKRNFYVRDELVAYIQLPTKMGTIYLLSSLCEGAALEVFVAKIVKMNFPGGNFLFDQVSPF